VLSPTVNECSLTATRCAEQSSTTFLSGQMLNRRTVAQAAQITPFWAPQFVILVELPAVHNGGYLRTGGLALVAGRDSVWAWMCG
jgi:hypothetical protein